MKDKEKLEKLHTFIESKYENIDLDHLVMFAINELDIMKANLSYENIVVASFKLFPKKFSLPGFPEYPDSNRVEQCLWRCAGKTRQWLGGKTRLGFTITPRSRNIFKESIELLEGKKATKTKAASQTRRKEAILAEIINSSAYKKYLDGKGNLITEGELCFLLQGTLDSEKVTLRKNLELLKMFADELEKMNISEFLEWIGEHFKKFLKLV
jgi:hypothetical protein